MALATVADVEARLGRTLTEAERNRTDPGLLDEASALVIGYLGCDPMVTSATPPTVPPPVVIVTSRMVARVLQQGGSAGGQVPVGADQVTRSMGPFSETYGGFGSSGASSGAPWIGSADRTMLKPYKCSGQAFAIDTAPSGTCHSEICSANRYIDAAYWTAYCTCGADIAGFPLYETSD